MGLIRSCDMSHRLILGAKFFINSWLQKKQKSDSPLFMYYVMRMNSKEVQAQLKNIIESVEFAKSPAMVNFLIYVVNETLAERGELLKEYSIAVEALGKDVGFDPQKSSSVRTLAGRVRKALNHYYSELESNAPIFISLPKGQYIPAIAPKGFAQPEGNSSSAKGAPPPWITRIMVAPMSSDDDSLNNVADSLSEKMTIALAAFDDLDVVSHVVAKTFFHRGGEIVDAMNELGAEFVCTGKIYQQDGEIILSVSVIDVQKGRQIWNKEFQGQHTDTGFAEFENHAVAISAGCIGGFFGLIARERSMPMPRTKAEAVVCLAFGAFLGAYQQLPSKEMFLDLIDKLDAALALNPRAGSLHALQAGTYVSGASLGFLPEESSFKKAKEHISLALLDQRISPSTRFQEGYYQAVLGRTELSKAAYEKCLAMNPNDIYMIRMCGQGLYMLGEYERGMELVKARLDSNPFFLKYNFFPDILEHIRRKEYEKALEAADEFYVPGLSWSAIARCVALYYLGRIKEAQDEYVLLLDICPDFSQRLDFYIDTITTAPELQKIFKTALRYIGEN